MAQGWERGWKKAGDEVKGGERNSKNRVKIGGECTEKRQMEECRVKRVLSVYLKPE